LGLFDYSAIDFARPGKWEALSNSASFSGHPESWAHWATQHFTISRK
jgi:hypothetical protein